MTNIPISTDPLLPVYLAAREYNVPIEVGPCTEPVFIQVHGVPFWHQLANIPTAVDFLRREA